MREKENETKNEKFVRLAEARTTKILETLQLLGNCSNTNVYEYTDDEIDQIFSAIEKAVRDAKSRFVRSESNKAIKFTLK